MDKSSACCTASLLLIAVFALGIADGASPNESLNSIYGKYLSPAAEHNAPLNTTDRQEIMDLIYLYSYTFDSKDLDGWLSLFTENATWSNYHGNSSVPDAVTRSNNDRRMLIGALLGEIRAQGVQSRHYMTNTLLKRTGDGGAEGITMFFLVWQYPSEASPRPANSGYYKDEFMKTESGWMFASREAHTDTLFQAPSAAPANVSS
jgi:hypothetical protein